MIEREFFKKENKIKTEGYLLWVDSLTVTCIVNFGCEFCYARIGFLWTPPQCQHTVSKYWLTKDFQTITRSIQPRLTWSNLIKPHDLVFQGHLLDWGGNGGFLWSLLAISFFDFFLTDFLAPSRRQKTTEVNDVPRFHVEPR